MALVFKPTLKVLSFLSRFKANRRKRLKFSAACPCERTRQESWFFAKGVCRFVCQGKDGAQRFAYGMPARFPICPVEGANA